MKLQINVKHYSTGEGCEFTGSLDGYDFNASPGYKVVPFKDDDGDEGFRLWEDRPDKDPYYVAIVYYIDEGRLCVPHLGVNIQLHDVGYDVTVREADDSG